MRVFKEEQRFDHWWIKLVNFGLLAFLIYCAYNWYFLKKSVGNVEVNNYIGQATVFISFVLPVLYLYSIKVKTIIDEAGIHYQFFPLHFTPKIIRWNEIHRCYVREYNPLKEYGGWGYRNPFGKNKAINVKGNQGIQIALKSGKKLLLGTQKEKDASKVIERYSKIGNE
ncbi:hypothetical protein [Maribacter sp. 2210JD10-5]|uniref:hypothetical protein n=1 Tax=Maribacter sp. 2210JD10-5 TaxID=3386272 RepID=UPI0039BC62F0